MKNALSLFLLLASGTSVYAAPDVTEAALHEEMRVQWGSGSHLAPHGLIRSDVTCDGALDYVASRLYLDNLDGPLFQVMIVTNHDPNRESSDMISFGFDGSTHQIGLCVAPEGVESMTVDVDLEDWTPEEMENDLGGSEGICTTAITISDMMCDSNRLFYLTETGDPDGHRFLFHRY